MLKNLINWVIPRMCVSCGFESDDQDIDLCTYCRPTLPWLKIRCYQCASVLNSSLESIVCEKCQSTAPPFNRVCALFEYKPPIIKLINALKFGQQLYPATLFGQLMTEELSNKWYVNSTLPEIIIPVPLHIERQRRRGYNQAYEIGLPVAKALNINISNDVCRRIRHTTAQAKLDREMRKRNLSSAFVVKNPRKYKHVALIDDVVTTGSTIRSLCTVLLAAGIECIDVWCVCRA